MKTRIKRFLCLITCLAMLMVLCSCTLTELEQEYQPAEAEEQILASGTVAKVGTYSLQWDAERVALFLYNGPDIVWSSLPLAQYNNPQEGGLKMYLESHLVVEYVNAETNTLETAYSHDEANERGRVYSSTIDNGIRIVYFFDSSYLAVPVEYTLKDGYLDVSINTKDIYEDGSQIYRVSLMPYAVSASNQSNNQLFIPDGCGMVMSCDSERPERTYNGKIYGRDYAINSQYQFSNEQSIRLPVFGALSSTDNSTCCIVDKGEGSAELNASAGNSDIGWSNAYTSFYIRGAETVWLTQKWGSVTPSKQYSERITNGNIGMRIYPMQKGADCADIATIYRNYLVKEMGLNSEATEQSLLYIDLPMAAARREFVFGYPIDTTKVLTSYTQAEAIISDIADATQLLPVVRLSGAQSGGLEIGKLAGNFKLESKLGSLEELKKILKKYEVYPDFDIVRFRKTSSGYKTSTSAAVTAASLNAWQYFIDLSTRAVNSNAYRYLLLSPMKLQNVSNTLLSYVEKQGFKTLSMTTAGKMNYSDYRYEESYVARRCAEEISAINKQYSEAGVSMMYDAANQYAAVGATHILNTPSNTSYYVGEDDWVPFYQMVFKGHISMSTPSVNLSNDAQSQLLYAAQTGIGLLFTVTGTDATSEFGSSPFTEISAGSYDTKKTTILESVKKLEEVHKATKNSSLIGFSKVADKVYQSDFDNGIYVIANYGTDSYNYKGHKIPGKTFIFEKMQKEGEAK